MKKVVFTVLTGNYDVLQQPQAIDPSWDYVCFTDRAEGKDGVWQIRPIPFEGIPVMRARWAKLHPHLLLPEYDISVFMDANLCIASADFYAIADSCKAYFAVPDHCSRDCVWDELRYCFLKDKVSTSAAVNWHRYLRCMDMPRHFGLAETNILLRRHNDPGVVAIDERWWELLVQSRGSRDQLCFTPALQQLALEAPEWLFGPGKNARNTDCVQYVNHPLTGKENVPGKLNWANLKYNLRLMWRKAVLPCLK